MESARPGANADDLGGILPQKNPELSFLRLFFTLLVYRGGPPPIFAAFLSSSSFASKKASRNAKTSINNCLAGFKPFGGGFAAVARLYVRVDGLYPILIHRDILATPTSPLHFHSGSLRVSVKFVPQTLQFIYRLRGQCRDCFFKVAVGAIFSFVFSHHAAPADISPPVGRSASNFPAPFGVNSALATSIGGDLRPESRKCTTADMPEPKSTQTRHGAI